MKKLLLSGIAVVALMAAGTAQAGGLSLTGETGVARTPVAVTLAPMSLAVAADYVASEDTFVPIRAEFGVIEGLEVGGNYWFMDTEGDLTQWGINAKYVIPAQLVDKLAIAAGANYQGLSADGGFDASVTTIYGVASYTLEAGVTIIPSAGVTYEMQGGDLDENGVRFFASILAKVMPNLAVGAEFVSTNEDLDGKDADASVWFGARFWPMENLAIQAGMINNADLGGDDPSDYVFHAGAQYSFSFAQ